MLGVGKRREAVVLTICCVLAVVAMILLAVGINTQSKAIGGAFTALREAARRPETGSSAPSAQIEHRLSTPLAIPEPAMPHGPFLMNVAGWITSDDYPAAARDQELQGTVRIKLLIDTAGRVTDCIVVRSSGTPILDKTTCRLALTRAHFYPARVSIHQALPSTWTRNIVWRLPDETGCAHDPAETCN